MGGSPRRGVLFEGPPGTGKTYLAKAMAAEAGVPFLFVSASEFQSMYYGQTNKKIRSFFKTLRKAGPRGGRRDRLHRGVRRDRRRPQRHEHRLDARGHRRASSTNCSSRCRASMCRPAGRAVQGRLVDAANRYLPAHRQAAQSTIDGRQRADRGGDEPGRRPRPGVAAPGALRSHHRLLVPPPRSTERRLPITTWPARPMAGDIRPARRRAPADPGVAGCSRRCTQRPRDRIDAGPRVPATERAGAGRVGRCEAAGQRRQQRGGRRRGAGFHARAGPCPARRPPKRRRPRRRRRRQASP